MYRMEFDKEEFDKLAAEYRYVITDMICRSGSGHLGGCLSIVEIVMTLYYRVMNYDPKNPRWDKRDRLVMSKGHAGPTLYAALAYNGFFPASWLRTVNQDGTRLPSHCDQIQTPGIDQSTGSLGQGLSCACGLSIAAKRDKKQHNVFCVIGDGESNEGQIWEAAMFASHYKLDNLIAICDYNKLQIDGFTQDVMGLEPLAQKWKAFGWYVMDIDGHDWEQIYNALTEAKEIFGKPVMIIANTVKAKGCCVIENKPESHNVKVTDRQAYDSYLGALAEQEIALPY